MNEKELSDKLKDIGDLDGAVMAKAWERQDALAKPPRSLGNLEEIAVRICGMSGKTENRIERRAITIFCADNGIWEEGVASAPRSVTSSQTVNFLRGYTGVATLARHFGVDLKVVDMGVYEPLPDEVYDRLGLIDRRIRGGTRGTAGGATDNFARCGSAMSREEAVQAVSVGFETAELIADEGYDIFGVGEMGIGNTTTSSAVLSALTGLSAEETVGRGGGLGPEGLRRKKEIVDEACRRNAFRGQSDIDVLDVLSKVGGFDIAAMCGAFLGAAYRRLPVVIDGYISAVSALAAYRLCPLSAKYMIPSHRSKEAGYILAMREMGLEPIFELGMRLGEGSGCPLAFEVVDAACTILNEMKTLEEAAVDGKYLKELGREDFD